MVGPLIEIRSRDLAQLGRALRAAGDGGFRAALATAEKREAEETAQGMHDAIPDSLPRGGGLAAEVAASTSFQVDASATVTGVRVRITASSPHNLARMNDSGSFSHPVFGGPAVVEQTAGVRRGFLDEEFHKAEPERAAAVAIAATKAAIDRSV